VVCQVHGSKKSRNPHKNLVEFWQDFLVEISHTSESLVEIITVS